MAQASIPLRDRAQPDRRPYFPAGSREVAYEDVEKTGPESLGWTLPQKVLAARLSVAGADRTCAPSAR